MAFLKFNMVETIVIFIDIVWKNIPMTSEKGNIDVIGNEDLISGDR